MKTRLLALVASLLLLPETSFAEPYVTNCGGTKFEVLKQNRGHPLDNVYRLIAWKPGQNQGALVHISDVGGWFYAACIPSKQGEPRLVFQEFCGGSACVEDKYGIVDPESLKILLLPSRKNEGNSIDESRVLKRTAPYLPREKTAFCCE